MYLCLFILVYREYSGLIDVIGIEVIGSTVVGVARSDYFRTRIQRRFGTLLGRVLPRL